MKGTDSGAERGHDNDAPSHSVWRACGEVYGQLARDSGLPGADVFVEGGRVRRLLWTAAVLTLVYYSASETGAILREYFTYSVAVAFEYNTNESFELPDVTVCNVNQLRRSKLCALEASERAMESELEERLCGKSQEFREANTDDLKLQHRLSDWLALTAVRNASQVETLGHQFTDVVIDCTYHEKDCKQARFFLNHTNPWYGNCFCIHCEKTDRLFDYNSLASPYNGLVMTLNPELHEYLPTSYQAGFLVMIHAHGTRHSVCSDGVYLTPGYTTYVGLSVLAQTGLPAPYANPCRRTWPKCLRELLEEPYGAYTREDCLNLCLQQMVVERCGCLTAQLPQLNKLATMYGACGENEYECVAQVSADATNMQLENRCQCHSACLDITYKRDVTVTHLREGVTETTKKNGPPARLVLYFDSLTYEHIRSVPKYDETRVLSNLGGISGMYLGLSFFVFFQVLDILVVGALRLRRMRHWDARQRILVGLARRGDARTSSHN